MANQVVGNKYTWVIKNFSSLSSESVYSDHFVIGGCKWRLQAYPKGGFKSSYFTLFLEVADYKILPPGWRRQARYLLTVVNQNSKECSKREEKREWFDETDPFRCSQSKIPVTTLHAEDGGFILNDEVKIVAEITVLQVIGNSDVSQEDNAARPQKKIKLEKESVVHKGTSSVEESIDVDGCRVLPSQVDSVKGIFKKHPDIALQFGLKHPLVKTAYMSVLLSLTEILRQSPQDISKDALDDAYVLLSSMKLGGFKVDCVEKKLNEMSEKKEKEQAYKFRMQEIEEEWKDVKAELLATKAPPLTLDDVF